MSEYEDYRSRKLMVWELLNKLDREMEGVIRLMGRMEHISFVILERIAVHGDPENKLRGLREKCLHLLSETAEIGLLIFKNKKINIWKLNSLYPGNVVDPDDFAHTIKVDKGILDGRAETLSKLRKDFKRLNSEWRKFLGRKD